MFGKFGIIVHKASIHIKQNIVGETKSFAVISIDDNIQQTSINDKSREEPQWNESLIFDINTNKTSGIKVEVNIQHKGFLESIGICLIDVTNIVSSPGVIFQKQENLMLNQQVAGDISLTIKYTAGEQQLEVEPAPIVVEQNIREKQQSDNKQQLQQHQITQENSKNANNNNNQPQQLERNRSSINEQNKFTLLNQDSDNINNQKKNTNEVKEDSSKLKMHYNKKNYHQPTMQSQNQRNENLQKKQQNQQQFKSQIIQKTNNAQLEELINPKRLKVQTGTHKQNPSQQLSTPQIKFKYQIPERIIQNMKPQQYKKEQLFQNPMRKVPTFGQAKRELQFTPDSSYSNRSFSEGPGLARNQVNKFSLKEMFYPPRPWYNNNNQLTPQANNNKSKVFKGIQHIMKSYSPDQIKRQFNFVPQKLEKYLDKAKEKKNNQSQQNSQANIEDNNGVKNSDQKIKQKTVPQQQSQKPSIQNSKSQSRVQSMQSINNRKDNNNKIALNKITKNSYLSIRMKGISFGIGQRNIFQAQQQLQNDKQSQLENKQKKVQNSLSPRKFNDQRVSNIGYKYK